MQFFCYRYGTTFLPSSGLKERVCVIFLFMSP